MRVDSQVNPYKRWVRKISSQILCGAGQPDLLFMGQVRDGPMRGEPARIATPKSW